jgi:outer membrane receptor for ferrienterochelin and colicin
MLNARVNWQARTGCRCGCAASIVRSASAAVVYNLLDKDFVSLIPYGTPVANGSEYANNQEPRRLWVSMRVNF